MSTVSVVVPVKDGERYLAELLAAVAREGVDEVIVIDSGSRDDSTRIAREAGATLIEIPPEQFGHGSTRNLGAELASGELICFLTQDATPVPGWLDAHREALALDERVGASYGPHLAREDTSPMIARELEEFFAGFSPNGSPVVQGPDDGPFLSNVNACYRRACWAEIRFAELDYAEDQAFAAAMLERGWTKAYHPRAAVLHAHDYGPVGFMRRYFDEYRGLRESIDHVEPWGWRWAARDVRRLVAADERWMRKHDWTTGQRAAWVGRSAVHHAGRKTFSALGSRAERLPAPVQRAISLERRASAPSRAEPRGEPEPPRGLQMDGLLRRHEYETYARFLREGPSPLLEPVPGMAGRERLHIAMAIPSFKRGSGGHALLFQILRRLELMGHSCSVWHVDLFDEQPESAAVIRGAIREHFAPIEGPVFKGFDDWYGADVALATGWQTVFDVMRLTDCRQKVYVVNDHEPEFYATSYESLLAGASYRQDLFCVCGSPWLRDLMTSRYGLPATDFEYGVDHDVYHERPLQRRRDTVVFYARQATPRRAVRLGSQALAELHRRRPDLRIVHFGDREVLWTPYPYEHVDVVGPEELSRLYAEATVGLSLSLTNFSLVPKEMMACGLPVVELAGDSARSIFGDTGPIELAEPDPFALADAIERLLDDRTLWERRSREGLAYASTQTWSRAAEQVERGLRAALDQRERRDEPLVRGAAGPPVAQGSPATERLLALIDDADVDAVEERLYGGLLDYWRSYGGDPRHSWLALAFGVYFGIPSVLEKTGLRPDQPSEEVHAMARGPLAAGGSYPDADFVADALLAAGAQLQPGTRGLDFGCSSGRIVRVLATAYPEIEWSGCDPIPDAIEWATANLPEVSFSRSPTEPPLEYPDASFDVAFAISIWSHFDAGAALRWLDEMRRIVRPGGHLLLTTHGPASIDYYRRTGERPRDQLEQIRRALYAEGFWYAPEFGEQGDHGIVEAEWGTSFMTLEWLLARVTPAWRLAVFRPAGNAGNQDVIVLERV